MSGTFAQGVRFAAWAAAKTAHGYPIRAPMVMRHFDCSRATAYRWIADYYDAMGMPQPERVPFGEWARAA